MYYVNIFQCMVGRNFISVLKFLCIFYMDSSIKVSSDEAQGQKTTRGTFMILVLRFDQSKEICPKNIICHHKNF